MACIIQSTDIQSPMVVFDRTSKTVESETSTNNEQDHQTIFFRFVHGKTITLTVNPNTEISVMKQMLLQKIALMDTIAATTNKPNATSSSYGTSTLVTKVLGLFWLSSLFTPKVQAQDLSFIYRGKPLEDDMSFRNYSNKIAASSSTASPTIHVAVRLYGGCFMVSASVLGLIITAIVGSTCTCGLSLIAVPFLLPLLFILPFFCL